MKVQSSTCSLKPGSLLLESAVAIMILSAVGIFLLKGSSTAIAGQNWATMQNLTDASLTYEVAYAQRIDFETLVSENSPWLLFPDKSQQEISVGAIPGGQEIKAQLYRTRFSGAENATSNPTGAESWKLQSYLVYEVGGRSYIKSRTVFRTQ